MLFSLIAPSAYRLSKAIGLSIDKLTPNLCTWSTLSADLNFVIAAPPKTLLFGGLCRALRAAVCVFISVSPFLQRYALSSPDISTVLPFYLCLYLFSPLARRSLDTQTKPSLPMVAPWSSFTLLAPMFASSYSPISKLLPKQSSDFAGVAQHSHLYHISFLYLF